MKTPLAALLLFATLTFPLTGLAHFQELIPSLDIVDGNGPRQVSLNLQFSHPMSGGPVMNMDQPVRFGVLSPVLRDDLLGQLQPRSIEGKNTYSASYRFKRPGDHIFYLQPAPYWEPDEGKMIIHYTKVVVEAFGAQTGWDAMVGFPVEIEPLVRPYGLWTNNLFRGIVRKSGQPVPFAEIEVEWRNDGSLKVPAGAYVTQLIKADANGQFSYAMPRSGWWGFAALLDADKPMQNPAGELVAVEQGALIWVHTRDMK
ncbi:MAG: DUF4198 domain-containing protein [Motiliproteus sp.]